MEEIKAQLLTSCRCPGYGFIGAQQMGHVGAPGPTAARSRLVVSAKQSNSHAITVPLTTRSLGLTCHMRRDRAIRSMKQRWWYSPTTAVAFWP